MSGPTLGSRTAEIQCRGEDRWPREAHEESDECWSWCTKESTGDEERTPKEDAVPEDADTALRMSGPTLGSRTAEIQCRGEDRWPREAHE
ncbi:hypothetical protein NDU88_004471 [Pleurodeles waltl]|uniref:Uncharacterized protein n=1 Tax=Pleurodeles waltl TaxID=8319 RepID=A0AAV7LK03_PLEWA|nr:hypothetical protein NDU88_004471 [Pleurodeles waltl]